MKWLICIFLMLSQMAFAGNLVLKVESSMAGALEQQAIVVGDEQLTFSRNSNFNCLPKKVVVLGKFDLPKQNPYWQAAQILQTQLSTIPLASVVTEKERIRYYVGERMVSDDHPMFHTISASIKRACDEYELLKDQVSNQELVIVKKVGNQIQVYDPQRNKTINLPITKSCQDMGDHQRCTIPEWGVANLIF